MVYKTQGTCSREIHFDVENNKLKNVSFVGGCQWKLKRLLAFSLKAWISTMSSRESKA